MKKQYAIPNTLALTTAIVYVVCAVLVNLFPDASYILAQSWFHGIQLSKLGTINLASSSFMIGLTTSTITAWIIGFIFIKVYKALGK